VSARTRNEVSRSVSSRRPIGTPQKRTVAPSARSAGASARACGPEKLRVT
jgi:hypothetical protein